MSGVAKGSVLGPELFIIEFSDIDANISSSVFKFADDTKLHSNVCTCDQTDRLQCDLNEMSGWSTKCQMSFNADKCKCLHEEHSCPKANYCIDGAEIEYIKAENFLGVPIGCILDSSLRCAIVVSTTNKVLGVTKRTYVHKSLSNVMHLYKVACKTTFRIQLSCLTSIPAKGH